MTFLQKKVTKDCRGCGPGPRGTRDGTWFVIVRLIAAWVLARVAALPARAARGTGMVFAFTKDRPGGFCSSVFP